MGNTLMALDTSLSIFHGLWVLFVSASLLLSAVHGFVGMAVATFSRVVGHHRIPNIGRQSQTMSVEFFRRIDSPENFVIDLVGGLDFTNEFGCPRFWHMAVGAYGPHAGTVGIVDCSPIFLEHVIFHFVARNAEVERIGIFHEGVEATPENNTGETTNDENGAPAVFGAWRPKPVPKSFNHVFYPHR